MLVTVGIMVVLGIFASGYRQQRAAAASGKEAARTPVPGGALETLDPTLVSDVYANPLDPPPKAVWDVLTNCQLLPNKTNAAHHFHVRRGSDPFVFQLYCAEAPEVAAPSEDQIEEQAEHFGLIDRMEPERYGEALSELGEKAWQAVEQLLSGRRFLVLTKWERRPDTHHYYAFVFIEEENGARRSLQEWLVEHGYAIITRPALGRLPTGETSDQFIERLERQQYAAQEQKRGGWAILATRR